MSLTTLTAPGLRTTAANDITIKVQTDVSLSDPFLRLQCILFIETDYGSDDYLALILDQWADPDADGYATFFVQDLIKDSFGKEYDWLQLDGDQAVRLQHAMRRWKWAVWEYSVSEGDVSDTVDGGTTPRNTLRGGITRLRHRQKPYLGENPFSTSWHNSLLYPFLDHRNKAGTLADGFGREWLSYIQLLTGVTSSLRVVCSWSDGSTTQHDALISSFAAAIHEVWAVPVGANTLGLFGLAPVGTTLVSYTVTMRHSFPGNSTGAHTFIIDPSVYRKTTRFRYLNSLGVWSDIWMRGALERTSDVDKDTHSQHWENGYDEGRGGEVNLITRVIDGATVQSGWAYDRQEHALYAEMEASEKVLMYGPESESYVPVSIKTVKWGDPTAENLRKVEIEYVIAHEDIMPDMLPNHETEIL